MHPNDMAQQRMDPLEYELQEARAMALGQAGKKVEKALAMLAAGGAPRENFLDDAATAVWELIITREALRFYDHEASLAFFNIPPAVMARVGVIKPKS